MEWDFEFAVTVVRLERSTSYKCNCHRNTNEFMLTTFLLGFTIVDLKCLEYLSISKTITKNFAGAPLPLIISGVEANEGEFPHMAQLGYIKNGSRELVWACGGSLISEIFVLTAAHCTNSAELGFPRMVRLGGINVKYHRNVQQRAIVQIIPYPKRKGYYNDIALIRLDHNVIFNYYVRPACLNTCKECRFDKAIASGFGAEEYTSRNMSDHLMKASLELYSNEECSKIHSDAIKEVLPEGVQQSQLCAGSTEGKDTCHGDSGGPLQIRQSDDFYMYRIIGITSFGLFCGQPNTPSFYTRISQYVNWIAPIVWGGASA